jgi:electron transfer flavoprotein beta subunit
MGADRAVLVACDPVDPWNVARILQQIVLRENADLVLMGKQAVDDDANQAGQFLAALLDWPQATFASAIEFIEGGVRVSRETDAGIEVIRTTLPAVITTDLRLNEPRYAALPSILRARRKPLERLALDQLQVTLQPRVRVLGMESAHVSRDCILVDSVDELIDRLRESKAL